MGGRGGGGGGGDHLDAAVQVKPKGVQGLQGSCHQDTDGNQNAKACHHEDTMHLYRHKAPSQLSKEKSHLHQPSRCLQGLYPHKTLFRLLSVKCFLCMSLFWLNGDKFSI